MNRRIEVDTVVRDEGTVVVLAGTDLDTQQRVEFAADHAEMPVADDVEGWQVLRVTPPDTERQRLLRMGIAPDEADAILVEQERVEAEKTSLRVDHRKGLHNGIMGGVYGCEPCTIAWD